MNDSPRVLGNRYEVGRLLGRGGMAEVHLGRDARLGRDVAIKLLRADLARDPTFQARFRREAQSAAALNHPAIVAVYDTGEESIVEAGGAVVNLPYIVMEHIQGRTLRDVLTEGHHLDVDAALDIITGVLTALEYSHRIGIVHRDIKPANVMLTPVGDVKVMDFGIARAMADVSSTMTQTQAVIGTAQYLSPEQARGEQVDTRSDLYSAGCLLYELLTGRPPFVADSPVAVAYQHVRELPIPPSRLIPGIPDSVDRIVLHSLAKGRDERYQTAADFRADVEAARGGQYVGVPVMHGSNATTQFVPLPDGTGTRLAPATGGLLGNTVAGQNPAAAYDAYGAGGDEYGGRRAARDEQQSSSNRKILLAGLAALVVLVLVGLGVWQTMGGGGSDTPTGPTTIALISTVGQDQAAAIAKLKALGFTDVKTEDGPSDADQQGNVIKQEPESGNLAAGDLITLTVGTGPATFYLPSVLNQTVSDATKTLTDAQLVVGDVKTVDDSDTGAGKITKTDPAPGEPVKAGDTVTLYVSSGKVSVPDVEGMTLDEAEAAITAKGLRFRVRKEFNESAPGTVLGTEPKTGKKVGAGSLVTIVIAKAPVDDTSPPAIPSTTPPVLPSGTETSPPAGG